MFKLNRPVVYSPVTLTLRESHFSLGIGNKRKRTTRVFKQEPTVVSFLSLLHFLYLKTREKLYKKVSNTTNQPMDSLLQLQINCNPLSLRHPDSRGFTHIGFSRESNPCRDSLFRINLSQISQSPRGLIVPITPKKSSFLKTQGLLHICTCKYLVRGQIFDL